MSQLPETGTLPTAVPPSLLILVLDLHPLAWSLLARPPPPTEPSNVQYKPQEKRAEADLSAQFTSLPLAEFINMLMVFLNAHMASRWGNRVVVYGATAGKSRLLYPPPTSASGPSRPKPNVYSPFGLLDSRLEESLKQMVQEEEEKLEAAGGQGLNDSPAIVSALSKALCFINRLLPTSHGTNTLTESTTSGPDQMETRILVVNATPGGASAEGDGGAHADGEKTSGMSNGDSKAKGKAKAQGGMRGGYVGLMNCVFAAQKAKVPIDVLTLPPPHTHTSPPIFLQQAAHLTEGIYWRWNGRGGLLQYLHAIYLPPPALRETPFAVPPQDAVDFRAVCFCHHDVVDVGFVCSVCLSIFCQPLPVCMMCKTKFPIKALATLRALAADIEPVAIPNTIPPVVTKQERKQRDAAVALLNGRGKRREEAIVVD